MTKTKSTNTNFKGIFKYFIWAIVSAFIFALITNTYYIYLLQNRTQVDYQNKLASISSNLETTFDELNQTAALLSLSGDVSKVINQPQFIRPKDYATILRSVEALQRLQITKSYITSTFIVHPPNDLVIGSNGTSSANEYFELLSNYNNYDTYFWTNLSSSHKKYIVLKPCIVTNTINDNSFKVIPTIHYGSNDMTYYHPVVINIDQAYVQQLLLDNQLTSGSLLYIYDKRGEIIANKDAISNFELDQQQLMSIASAQVASGSFKKNFDGNNFMTVVKTDSNSNYTFIAIVPYIDFFSESLHVITLPLIILVGGIILVTLFSFFLSRRIYNPIQVMIKDNKRLQDDLDVAIPYVCERYLLSIFNDNKIMKEEDVQSFLADYDFSFPGSHFMVIQTILNFNEDYFETHTRAEYNAVCQGGLAIATKAFEDLSHSYVFSVGINQICIILNLNKKVLKADIMASIQDYHKDVDALEENTTIHSGIGRLYEGYEGMQKSYQESLTASSQLTYMTTSMIRTYSKSDDAFTNSHYTIEDENKLVNYLLQGSKEHVFEQVNTILDTNVESQIGIHALRELYLQLYNTAVRVTNTREISIYDIMGEDYLDISTHMSDLKPAQLHDYIVLLFGRVIESSNKKNEKSDIDYLKAYLENHYCEDIYLDALAEHFGKSPKYMSKFIKKTLGTTFQDYVSTLRINHAKNLLLTTKDSVNTIAESVGFNSRHPFIRKFKILEGVTPTEYRKLHK